MLLLDALRCLETVDGVWQINLKERGNEDRDRDKYGWLGYCNASRLESFMLNRHGSEIMIRLHAQRRLW